MGLDGCVIVSGMPGAGKSTVSALAARLLPRAACVKGDDVSYMVLSGRVRFDGEPAEEAARRPSERVEFDGYERLDAGMRADPAGPGWWFDTSALTPEETAARLVAQMGEHPRLGG